VSPTILNKIGYLPEERGLYQKNKLMDAVLYFATLKGMAVAEARAQADLLFKRFDLSAYAEQKN